MVQQYTKTGKETEKALREISREYKRLVKPLEANKELKAKLEEDKKIFVQEEQVLKLTKDNLSDLETRYKNLSWEHEILEQKSASLEAEKEALEKKLEETIYSIQQKTGFKNLVLEKKLEAMAIDLQKTEAALAEVIASTNMGSGAGEIKNSLEEVLMAKNQIIQRLERTLAELKQKYHDSIVKYENKLGEYNIPTSELGFTPVKRF